ncbi:MAG TPA: DsbA family protein [Solirubrobacteraceae bacterium]|jgi:2-hydroxychromene-2-carboxylate isomerase|nr:DsbA family protein [Solirubrobacteraceae bacterium]
MSAAAPPIFYFGVMSPYSWFAAERIGRLLPQARWRGVLAGVVFKEHDRTSWGLTERRADGIADCEMRASEHGLGPIAWPQPWPTSDLRAGRALAFCQRLDATAPAADIERPDRRSMVQEFALAAMRMAFLEGADLEELDSVLEAGRRCEIAEHELRRALEDQQVKDRLRAITGEAIEAGVFGVPTVRIGDQLFWGDDRLQDAANAYRADTQE